MIVIKEKKGNARMEQPSQKEEERAQDVKMTLEKSNYDKVNNIRDIKCSLEKSNKELLFVKW